MSESAQTPHRAQAAPPNGQAMTVTVGGARVKRGEIPGKEEIRKLAELREKFSGHQIIREALDLSFAHGVSLRQPSGSGWIDLEECE